MLVLPAFGITSEVIPVFSRKAIFGYPAMVAASVGIAFVDSRACGPPHVSVGMTSVSNAFFTLSTMLVGIPELSIKIFNWIATMWGGKIRFATPMLFCTALVFQFTIAGLTGIIQSVAPVDWQLHNSYFVIAHFHYVLVGAVVMGYLAGYLLLVSEGLETGRMMNETLGKSHFWLFVIGFHVCFDTMHFLGVLGMPTARSTPMGPTGAGAH